MPGMAGYACDPVQLEMVRCGRYPVIAAADKPPQQGSRLTPGGVSARRQYNDIPCTEGHFMATGATKHNAPLTGSNAKNRMRGGMVMMEVLDSVSSRGASVGKEYRRQSAENGAVGHGLCKLRSQPGAASVLPRVSTLSRHSQTWHAEGKCGVASSSRLAADHWLAPRPFTGNPMGRETCCSNLPTRDIFFRLRPLQRALRFSRIIVGSLQREILSL